MLNYKFKRKLKPKLVCDHFQKFRKYYEKIIFKIKENVKLKVSFEK